MQVSTHGIGKLSPKSTLMIRMMTIIAAGVIPFVIAASTKMNTIRGYRGQESRQLEHDQCDSMITNGKFEGSLEGWSAHGGGSISFFDDSVYNTTGSENTCLLFSGRTDRHFGPAYELLPECFTSGLTYRISAYMKLAVNATTDYQPFYCDRSLTGSDIWQRTDVCPMLTFEVKTSSGQRHWAYARSFAVDDWIADEWNEFTADLLVTDKLSNITEVKMYFERVRENVDILLDEVTIETVQGNLDELGAVANEIAVDHTYNCSHMVMNSDFEEGNQTGWTTRHGGKLLLYPHGYANSDHALLYTARNTPFVGPKHVVLPRCVTEGKLYQIEAQMKLLDEHGMPFICDKSRPWDHDVACPLLTVQYTTQDDVTKHVYYENEDPDMWQGDLYNWYFAEVYISTEMKYGKEIFFYFERVKEGVSIIFDNSHMNRDCTELIPNGFSHEGTGPDDGWIPSIGNGVVVIEDRTIGTGENATNTSYFVHRGREAPIDGPRQNIDPLCFIQGSKYQISLDLRLENSNGTEYICDKAAESGPDICPLVSFAMASKDGIIDFLNVKNRAGAQWESGFNEYSGIFTVTEKMATSFASYFFIRGPRQDVDIVFDNVLIEPYFPVLVTCDELIYNGGAEMGNDEWNTYSGGHVGVYEEGFNSTTSIQHFDRTSSQSSLVHYLNPECLIEGQHYVFRAQFKLLDEDGNPYECDKSNFLANPEPCIIASLYVELPHGIAPLHIPNKSPTPWKATEWNVYRSDFMVNFDFAEADLAELKIRGPKAGITVLMDNASIQTYVKPEIDCHSNFVKNGDAEDMDFSAWKAYGGGKTQIYPMGAFGSEYSILHSQRTHMGSGLRQDLATHCLVEGKMYQLTTHFKLYDENMAPFSCSKAAQWGAEDYCVLLALEYKIGTTTNVINLHSNVHAPWVADEFNFYHKIFHAEAELAIADQVILQVKGPRPGVSVLMDEVKLHEYTLPEPSCTQLVRNPSASTEDLLFWQSINGGDLTFAPAGMSGNMAFMLTNRPDYTSAPRYNFDMSCLGTKAGSSYEVNALFQLLDSERVPYACNKAAPWRDPLYCILMTVEMITKSGQRKRFHLGNNYGGAWVAEDMNTFTTRFRVSLELAQARSAFVYFQGPPGGTSMIFDHVTITDVSTIE